MSTERTPNIDVRKNVRELLLSSEAFRKLPAETQQQIAHDTTRVADYIAAPEGFRGHTLRTAPVLAKAQTDDPSDGTPDPSASTYARDVKEVDKVGGDFKAGAASEGVRLAGAMMKAVDFPQFVAALIQGVFHA